MFQMDFTEVSRRYERDSSAQKAAAEILLGLLQIGPEDDVLDLGCGTGHVARRVAEITRGEVVGLDPSTGMIAQARAAKGGGDRIRFESGAAEDLQAHEAFDAIVSNSALQWFRDPAGALAACRRALRPGGRMALQAPARQDYCPTFLRALAEVARRRETAETFARFRSPWFFLETAEAYADLFQKAGFLVPLARIEEPRTRHSPEHVLNVFESGASVGYLNPACYDVPLTDGYVECFRRFLGEAFRAQAGPDGQVELVFHRVYVLAVKPT